MRDLLSHPTIHVHKDAVQPLASDKRSVISKINKLKTSIKNSIKGKKNSRDNSEEQYNNNINNSYIKEKIDAIPSLADSMDFMTPKLAKMYAHSSIYIPYPLLFFVYL